MQEITDDVIFFKLEKSSRIIWYDTLTGGNHKKNLKRATAHH